MQRNLAKEAIVEDRIKIPESRRADELTISMKELTFSKFFALYLSLVKHSRWTPEWVLQK